MVRFDGDLQPNAVKFTHAAFWIRIVNLPIKSMTKEVGEDIGQAVGTLLDVDVPDGRGIAWGLFLRIRVDLDLAKPFMRGCIVQVESVGPFWVDFQYEHLSTFCYRCGILGHSGNDCTAGKGGSRAVVFYRDHYGSWLRAVPLRSTQFGRRSDDIYDGASSENQSQRAEFSGGPSVRAADRPVQHQNEATSSINPGIQNHKDNESITISVEAVAAEHEVLHVPNFMEVQFDTHHGGLVEGFETGRASWVEGSMPQPVSVHGVSEGVQHDGMLARSLNQPDQLPIHLGVQEVEGGGSEVRGV